MREEAQQQRQKMMEAAAEQNDDIMEKYLEGEEITNEEHKHAIREGHPRPARMAPVLLRHVLPQQGRAAAAGRHRGRIMPSPLDVPPAQGILARRGPTPIAVRHAQRRGAPSRRLAFQSVAADPYRGQAGLSSGCTAARIKAGSYVYNAIQAASGSAFGRIVLMHAAIAVLRIVEAVYAGDIAALRWA